MSRVRPVVLRKRRAFSVVVGGAASESFAERGYAYVKGLRVLDDVTVAKLRVGLPLLFRGEFDSGVYPDEMHWREGISRDDAPREVGRRDGMVCRHMMFTAQSACTHISQCTVRPLRSVMICSDRQRVEGRSHGGLSGAKRAPRKARCFASRVGLGSNCTGRCGVDTPGVWPCWLPSRFGVHQQAIYSGGWPLNIFTVLIYCSSQTMQSP